MMAGVVTAESTPFLNFNRICRMCVHEELDLLPIFESKMGSFSLALQIKKCVGLEVSKDDALPKQVCQKCYQLIDNWTKFKELCENSNELLLQYSANPQSEVLLHIPSPRGEPSIPDDLSEICQNFFENQSLLEVFENEQTTDFWLKNLNRMEKLEDSVNTSSFAKTMSSSKDISKGLSGSCKSLVSSENEFLSKLLAEGFNVSDKFSNTCKNILNSPKIFGINCFDQGKAISDIHNLGESALTDQPITLKNMVCENLPKTVLNDQDFGMVCKDLNFSSQADNISRHDKNIQSSNPLPVIKSKGKGITLQDCVLKINNLKASITESDPEKRALFLDRYYRLRAMKYICGVGSCEKVTTRFCDLLDHDTEAHADLPLDYGCKDCGKCFISSLRLEIHSATKHSTKEFPCDICEERFASKHSLTVHVTQHERSYVCDQCGAAKTCRASLDAHMNKHLKTKPFVCDICSQSFSTNSSRKRHYKAKHEGVNRFKCDQCDYRTSISENLSYHKNSKHESKKLICPECGKIYTTYSIFMQHLKSHSASYPCEICDKVFKRPYDLNRHKIKIHGLS